MKLNARVIWSAMACGAISMTSLPSAEAATPSSSSRLEICDDLQLAARSSVSKRAAVDKVNARLQGKAITRETLAQAIVASGTERDLSIYSSSTVDLTAGRVTASARLGLCVYAVWLGGKVVWSSLTNSPASYPYYFSYKPESSNTLAWAAGADDLIDGVYRRALGSCSALKVPNGARITVTSLTSNGFNYTTCQSLASQQAGGYPRVVYTCGSGGAESSWPDSSL